MPTTVMDVSAPSFNSNEAHPQSEVQYSLEVNPTDLPNTKSCCRTELGVSIPELHEMPMHNPVLKIGQSVFSEEAEKTASLLLEQERLKQMVHDLEQEKSEMENTLEDMRAQLQSKTLETTQQNLYESIEQKDALAVDSDIDLEKASGLLEERLRLRFPVILSYRRAITVINPSKWQRIVEIPVWNANSSYSLSTCSIQRSL
jgi:hypothetical protein